MYGKKHAVLQMYVYALRNALLRLEMNSKVPYKDSLPHYSLTTVPINLKELASSRRRTRAPCARSCARRRACSAITYRNTWYPYPRTSTDSIQSTLKYRGTDNFPDTTLIFQPPRACALRPRRRRARARICILASIPHSRYVSYVFPRRDSRDGRSATQCSFSFVA